MRMLVTVLVTLFLAISFSTLAKAMFVTQDQVLTMIGK